MKLLFSPKKCFSFLIFLLIFSIANISYAQNRPDNTIQYPALQGTSIKINAAGKLFTIPVFSANEAKDKYISLSSKETKEILSRLGTSIRIRKNEILFSGFSEKTSIEKGMLKKGGDAFPLGNDFFYISNEPYIHLKYISEITGANAAISKEMVYIDPTLNSIESKQKGKKIEIRIICTASCRYNTIVLNNPGRIAIDIENVQLTKEQTKNKKETDTPLGKITFAQNRTFPNYVRVVIPADESFSFKKERSSISNEILLSFTRKSNAIKIKPPQKPSVRPQITSNTSVIRKPQITVNRPVPITTRITPSPEQPQVPGISISNQDGIYIPPQGSSYTKVSNLSTVPGTEKTQVKVELSASSTYKFFRFPAPDNRFIIDIQQAVLTEKKQELAVNSDQLTNIRIAQFQPAPNPVVRIVGELKNTYTVDIDNKTNVNLLVVSINNTLLPSDAPAACPGPIYPPPGRIICIDAGHGGYDCGATNSQFNITEKELTLNISLRLAEILRQRGWTVTLTRTTDRDVSYWGSSDNEELGARVNSSQGAGVFISIHCDASSNTSVKGVSTHWYKCEDEFLAKCIQDKLSATLPTKDRGVRRNNFNLLARSSMPAALIETGFITNCDDFSYLSDKKGIDTIATGIADAIENYFKAFSK